MDADRLTVAMHALACMRFYTPIFPGDHVPFRAVAAAMAHGQGHDKVGEMVSYREAIQERMDRCHQMYEASGSAGVGMVLAADQTIQLVMLAISDDCQLDKAESHRRCANDACTGIGLSLL